MSALQLYRFGIEVGWKTAVGGNLDLGLRSLANPVRSGFIRYREMPYTIGALSPRKGERILDVASPKHLALYLGSRFGVRVTAIDLLDDFVEPYRTYSRHVGAEQVEWLARDGRRLPEADDTYDHVYSVSVLEHIPDDGDTDVIREMARVLKPGGTCVITVPFASRAFEVRKSEDVYERKFEGEPLFFQRHYDDDSLRRRLLEPSGLGETDRVLYRSRWRIESLWEKLPRRIAMLLLWAGPLWAVLSHGRITPEEADRRDWFGFCCLKLRKPAT